MTEIEPSLRALPAIVSAILRPLPLAPLQPLLGGLLAAVVRRHPQIFDRLGAHSEKRFGVEPTDLPFAFVLEPRRTMSRVTAVRRLSDVGLDATITGTLAALVTLADGDRDGDALFFSRDVTIEGDVEAVVALRNAMDDAGVDLLRDSVARLGAFGAPLERVIRIAVTGAQRRWN